MLALKKVAVTGGLASGKTTVCQLFKKLGAYVVNADEIVHTLLSHNSLIQKEALQIVDPFGKQDQKLDRLAIAREVFKDPQKLQRLEMLLHKEVFLEIERQYEKVKQERKHPLFVAEIPLFYESQDTPNYDVVICVKTKDQLAKERFLQRKHVSSEEFSLRMQRQLPPEEKEKRAHYILDNSGSLTLLENQVSKLFSLLTSTRGS